VPRARLVSCGIAEKLAEWCAISGAARVDLSYPESGTATLGYCSQIDRGLHSSLDALEANALSAE